MKRILTILAVGLLAITQSADAQLEQTGMPPTTAIRGISRDSDGTDQEALEGKDIVIRLYHNWTKNPAAFEKAYVEFHGFGFNISDEQMDAIRAYGLGQLNVVVNDERHLMPAAHGQQFNRDAPRGAHEH